MTMITSMTRTTPEQDTTTAVPPQAKPVARHAEQTHEHLQSFQKVKASSDRVFGLVLAGFFILVALLPLLHQHPIKTWAFVPAAALGLPALVCPRMLAPLNRAWTKLGLLLNRIVSPVILGVIFFLVVTPLGVIMRLVGSDPLKRTFNPDLPSYWDVKDPPGPPSQSMADPF